MIEQSVKVYFSPDDNVQQAVLDLVSSAAKSIRLADYSFNLVPLVDILIAKQAAGLDIKLVLDKSQAAGSTEKPEVVRIKAAGIPLVIGTSDEHHIMHSKYVVIDGQAVGYGSYNFTKVAEEESNVFVIETNAAVAAAFSQNWQAMWDWISQHEPQS